MSTATSAAPTMKPQAMPKAKVRAVRLKSRSATLALQLFLEDDRRPGLDERCDAQRIPIRQPHAPVRLRAPDGRWFRRSVQPVVFLRQVDPDDAHWIVRTGLNRRLRVCRLGIPEQFRVVVKLRIEIDARD